MATEDGITQDQVAEIIGRVTDEPVTSFEYRPGNESDHCFVSLTSGERLVIRFARDEPEHWHFAVERFVRQDFSGELFSEATGLSAPRTLHIDATGSVMDAVFAIQTFVAGESFRSVFSRVTPEQQVRMLAEYGAIARTIHSIEVPPYQQDPENDHLVMVDCRSPVNAWSTGSTLDTVIDRLDPVVTQLDTHAECQVKRTSFYRTVFTANSVSAFREAIDQGIQSLVEDHGTSNGTATCISELFERNAERVARHVNLMNFCNGDYHFDNLLVTQTDSPGEWAFTALLDMEMPQIACPIEDFGKPEEYDFPDIELAGYRRHVLEGYGDTLDQLEYSLMTLGSLLSQPRSLHRALALVQRLDSVDERRLVEAFF